MPKIRPATAPAVRAHPRLTAAERRKRIVRSSAQLFARRGFAASRTKDLAHAAGVSEAMLYKLFPDKESLYRAILEDRIAEMERALPLAGLEASTDPPERFLLRVAATCLDRIEEDPSFLRLLLFSALEGHPLAEEFDRARGDGARRVIAGHLRRHAADFSADADPDFAARAFMGVVVWFAIARTLFREPGALRWSRTDLAEGVVRLFLEGLRPRRAPRKSGSQPARRRAAARREDRR